MEYDSKCPRIKQFLEYAKKAAPFMTSEAQSELWHYAKQFMDTGMDYVPRSFTPIEYNLFSHHMTNNKYGTRRKS